MKEKIKSYGFIIIIAILVSIPMFQSNFNIYFDDGIQHVCRLMGTYQSIAEGQPFGAIMSNFCNGLGYSWNLFYSPMTAYVPLLLHFITNSFILDLKIFMLVATILSGITMYEFIVTVTKNKYAGLIGAVIYMLAPYRLTDMYMRLAVAELTSFIFLPMVFQGLYVLFQNEEDTRKLPVILIIGASALILTHMVIAMYTAIIAGIYIIIHIKKLKNKRVLSQLFISLLIVLCITSFFWVPLLEHKTNTQYEVFKQGRMERTEVLVSYKLDFVDLLYTGQKYMSFEIGLVTLIGLVLTILTFSKIDKNYQKLYIFSLMIGIGSIVMTTKWFPFEKLPSILKMLQFSFRMLEFSSFFLSFVVAINYALIIKNFKMKDVCVLTLLVILLTIPLTKQIKYQEGINENDLWPAIPVTQNTKRVHAGCATFEYLPSKAFEHLDGIKIRKNKVYVLQGNAKITDEAKNGTNLIFRVQDIDNDTVLELPYIYYLGYEAILQTEAEEKKMEMYESENGLIEIHLDSKVQGTICVRYIGTMMMKISAVISILSFTGLVLYWCIHRKNEK